MRLHMFISNDRNVLKGIPTSELASGLSARDIDFDIFPI